MNTQEIYKQRIEEASIEYTMKTRPMCIAGDAFADMAIEINKNPAFISGANFALQNQWISVEEALPEIVDGYRSALVIVRSKYNSYDVAKWDEYYKDWITPDYSVANVTHWMPIPKLKGGEK